MGGAQGAAGYVWVEFPELGERIAKAAGVPFTGAAKKRRRRSSVRLGSARWWRLFGRTVQANT